MIEIGTAGDAHSGRADEVERAPQLVDPGAEATTVERLRTHRTAPFGVAFAGVKVGHFAAGEKLHLGVALKELDHLRALFEKGFHVGTEHVGVQFMTQVNPRLFEVFHDVVGDGQWIARNPQPTPRPGTGAAEQGFFFHHDHLQAQLRRGHRRGQTGSAGADDQHITKQGIAEAHRDYREKA